MNSEKNFDESGVSGDSEEKYVFFGQKVIAPCNEIAWLQVQE